LVTLLGQWGMRQRWRFVWVLKSMKIALPAFLLRVLGFAASGSLADGRPGFLSWHLLLQGCAFRFQDSRRQPDRALTILQIE